MVLRIETVSPPQILWSNDPPWPCSGPFRGPIGSALLPSSCYNKFPKRDKYMSIYCMCGQVVVANIIQYSVWLFCHSGDLSVLTHIYIFYTALNHPSPTRCYWWQYLSMKSYWLCSLSHYVSLISTEYVGRFSFPCNLQRIIGGAVHNSIVFCVLFPVHSFPFEISDNSEHELDKNWWQVQVYR